MTLQQFKAAYLGKGVDYDGYYGNQCVDLIEFYLRDVIGIGPFWGNAIDWYRKFGAPVNSRFSRVANNPNDPNQLPKPGDIIIWAESQPGSGGYGHIAIVLSANSRGFVSLDQNWGGMYVREIQHNWDHVIGWLSLNTNAPVAGDIPMNKDEEANAYRIVLGREMEHAGSGRTGYKFIVDAQAEVAAQRTGTSEAIKLLKAQLAEVQAALQNEQNRPPKEVVKEVEKIVEKVVEVPVYTHDAETAKKIDVILKVVLSIKGLVLNLFKKGK